MKFHVIGVKRIEGTAKASGNPFDMCKLFCLVPIETGAGKTKVSGFGMEVAEMDLEPEAMKQFAGLKFPTDCELHIEQKFMFGEFRSIVAGIDGQAKSLHKVG